MRGRGERDRRDVPQILDAVRTRSRTGRAPQVAPNHVLFGSTHAVWGPAREVRPATHRPTYPEDGPGRGVTIVVLDTGTAQRGPDFDKPDENGDKELDHEAGHGVFVEGVIRRYAPAAEVVHKRVLTSDGRVSDSSLASEMAEIVNARKVDIINLSLGGYTYDNRGAYAFGRVLNRLRREHPNVAIVAAAGNDHTDRPFFPAAAKGVIAVAAYHPLDAEKRRRASYSNFGWWVDVRAKGEHDSTYYDIKRGPYARLKAPGELTLAQFEGFANWEGTSFAAPVMAGAIAARMTEGGVKNAREAARLLLDDAADSYEPELGVLIDPVDHTT
jgi:subtilisin family serine protease